MGAEQWPALPLEEWKDTYQTLHMWTQVVGKVRLRRTPLVNHWWNVTFHLTPRGLTTRPMPYEGRAFAIDFDFIDHRLIVTCSGGTTRTLPLVARPVADFYRDVMRTLGELGIAVRIWPVPVEVPDPIPFAEDFKHASYEPEHAARAWRVLVQAARVLEQFRARFVGKCSPVHFFWGSFDLAVTRFSGRRAPPRDDPMNGEAYSHEVISHGFWPGNDSLPMPVFYAYAAPEPEGFKTASVRPAGARYDTTFSEFFLPYDEVRRSASPDEVLLDFLESTYAEAALRAGWDRAALERAAGTR